MHDRHGEGRPAPLAQPQAHVDERRELEVLERRRRSGLGRPMTGDQVAPTLRDELGRDKRSGIRDQPVEEHRHPARCPGGDEAGKRGDLEPTDFGKDGQRIRR